MFLGRARRRWQLGGQVLRSADGGQVPVYVPRWLLPAARQWVWVQVMRHAQIKWAARTAVATLPEWKAAMRRHGPQAPPPPD